MRTCMEGCSGLQPAEVLALARPRDGALPLRARVAVISGYALYTPGLADAMVQLASQVRAHTSAAGRSCPEQNDGALRNAWSKCYVGAGRCVLAAHVGDQTA